MYLCIYLCMYLFIYFLIYIPLIPTSTSDIQKSPPSQSEALVVVNDVEDHDEDVDAEGEGQPRAKRRRSDEAELSDKMLGSVDLGGGFQYFLFSPLPGEMIQSN